MIIHILDYISLFSILVFISIIDIKYMRVYDIAVISGIIIKVIFIFSEIILYSKSINTGILYELLFGIAYYIASGLVGFVVSFLLCRITNAMGDGDILVYTYCCAFVGMKYSYLVFCLSFTAALVYSLFMIALYGYRKNMEIPFVPFISIATVIVQFYGKDIIYFLTLL